MKIKFRRYSVGGDMEESIRNAIRQMEEEGFEDPSWHEIAQWMGEHIRIVEKEDEKQKGDFK